ncbi:conserved hypothetical protein [anaerobic digester metagenome]|uniref:Uncharacterized protein n=1 Tax=anaerobic digester metagenome TaxID=1263854 RepID=A0A485M850_9ZZZZ
MAGAEEQTRQLSRRLLVKLGSLSQELEKFNIAEYIGALNNPRRYLMINFVGGVVRGLGFAVGATLLAGLVVYLLQRVVMLNLPVIGGFIAELVKIVNQRLE